MRFSSKLRQLICYAVLLLTPEIVDGGGIDISDRAKSSIVNVNSAYTDSDLLDPQSSSPPSQMGIFTQVLGDPGNLELNFLLFKKQLAENNVKGATATLERVLLTDPKSKLARVMYAQLKLRMGNRTEGLRNLNQIVQDETASDDMRRNAASLRDGIKRTEQMNVRGTPRKKFVSRFKLGGGIAENALGSSEETQITFFDNDFLNSVPNIDENFTTVQLDVTYTPEFNLGDDEFLQFYVSNQIKDFNDLNRYDLSLTTLGMSYSKGLGENNTKTLGFSASITDINLSWHNYAKIYNLTANLKLPMTEAFSFIPVVAATRSVHGFHPDIAINNGNTGWSYKAGLGAEYRKESFFISLQPSLTQLDKNDKLNNYDQEQIAFVAGRKFEQILISGRLFRSHRKYELADPFISSMRKRKDRMTEYSASLFWTPKALQQNRLVPQLELSIFHKETRSNLPNFSKETTDFTLSMSWVF
ncbi:hypothetical protein RS24_02105 [Candidatus Micropelagos thuwalensis]|uniref:Surface lipoprotein assembly modifier C-terminal domain-containing protein n=1 Tax=Candidatus Micropelagius thuwalensis TaxID=1397666 RepID=U2W8W7_9PROT|nr:porin family protein [Candidatus Micropelagos thuwalensis]ERL46034.1 hypothetical protein RS24_02105 [Candidatus Micropelagos thuwalensis]